MAAEDARLPHEPLGRFEPPQAPAAAVTFGMWMFLAALMMLFAAGLLGYVVVRLAAEHPAPGSLIAPVPSGSLQYPKLLWFSTAFVLAVSVALSRALHFLRIERQAAFGRWLAASLLFAAAFLIIQAPAMALILTSHQHLRGRGLFLYGLIFFLVLLHALHVVGGVVALARVAVRGRRGVYDHEHYLPVRHAAMYWHFLDVVWIVMFTTFLATQ